MNKFDLLCSVVPGVSRETYDRLLIFEQTISTWPSNLVARSQLDDLWPRHIVDCAQLSQLRVGSRAYLDLGSGGGFPGLVLAILSSGTPIHYTLVESNQRKAAFLRSMVDELGLNATVRVDRFERLEVDHAVEVITARAVTHLDRLLALTSSWLPAGKVALFMKGKTFRDEVSVARKAWDFDLIEHVSATDEAARVLEISALKYRKKRS